MISCLRVDQDDIGMVLERVGDEGARDADADNHHDRPPAPVRMDPSASAGHRSRPASRTRRGRGRESWQRAAAAPGGSGCCQGREVADAILRKRAMGAPVPAPRPRA